MSAQPDVVWDRAKDIVTAIDIEYSAKAVFQVVPATRFEGNSVNVEPGTPEGSSEEVYMAVDETARVVPEANVHCRLDIKVNDTKDSGGCQQ